MVSLKSLVLAVAVVGIPALASAQATGTSKIVWDQPNATLAEASTYTYRYYPDAVSTGTVLGGVTCSAVGAIITCQAAFPAFTPGAHTIALSAANTAGEGLKSTPFPFTFVVVPSAPVNLRLGQ